MKKFLLAVAIFVLTLIIPFAVFMAYVQHLPNQFSTSLMGSLDDKYELLQQETSEPRLIFVSGSSSVYGTDCELVTELTGMDCICVGAVQGVGIELYTNLLKGNIREGDIIYFAPEYNMWDGIFSGKIVWCSCESEAQLYTKVPLRYWPQMLSGGFFGYAKDKISLSKIIPEGTGDVCTMVGPKGDINIDRPETLMEHGWLRDDPIAIDTTRVDARSIKSLNWLYDYCEKQGATLLIGYPPITEPAVCSSEEEIDAFCALLEQELKAPVIGDIRDSIMDKELFYDSNYHLINEGTEIRTRYVCDLLMPYINNRI